MGKTTRRELLKGGVAGAAAVAAIPFTNSIVFASEGSHVLVHVHARVQNPDPSIGAVDINVDVAGRRQLDGSLPALSGAGWDTADADAPDQSGACYFSQRGKLEGPEVKLHGRVFFFNDPANKGASVTTTANLKTGEITWTFDVFAFTGKGVVLKFDGNGGGGGGN